MWGGISEGGRLEKGVIRCNVMNNSLGGREEGGIGKMY
jgi:hypothetical protein